MPAARGVKRAASQSKPKAAAAAPAGPSKNPKKAHFVNEEPTVPTKPGEVFACGQGDVGQLGLGEDVLEVKRFSQVKTLPSNIVAISAGGMHTVLLDKNGKVWTFGCNDEGTLGRDTTGENSESVPGTVVLPGKAIRISAGDSHSAALLESGQVFAWGSFRDSYGNMGLTLKGNERKPVEMLPGHHMTSIASGADHLVMLTDQGQIFTCGCGEQGQLGRVPGRSCDRKSRSGMNPLLVPAPLIFSKDKTEFDAVWAGTYTTFARKAGKGEILVWGLNNYGQIGVRKGKPGTVFGPVRSEAFSGVENVVWNKITSGLNHTLALDSEGVCYVLGRSDYGRLGLGEGCSDATDLVPVPTLKEKKCIDISCGSAASFAVLENGEVYAWGMGSSFQLGTGSDDDENIPVLLRSKQLEGRSAINVSAGGQHTVLLVATLKDEEDTADVPEAAATAPKVKAVTVKVGEKMEIEPTAEKESEEDSDKATVEKVDAKAPEKPAKAAAKRGRKASAADSQAAKKVNAKQNGGLSSPREETKEVDKVTPMEVDSTEPESVKGDQEKPEGQQKKQNESIEEEPSSKRIKLDVETEKTEEGIDNGESEKTKITSVETETAVPTVNNSENKISEIVEDNKEVNKKAEECPVANVNGSSEQVDSQKEIQDVVMKSTEVEPTEKKIEAQVTTDNTTEVNVS